MANCHPLFQRYNAVIRLNNDKRAALMVSRDSLRQRILDNYKLIPLKERQEIEIYFQTQGSFIMDTIITPIIEDFDLDDGVYFQGDAPEAERPTPQQFHDWVIRSVDKDNDYEEVKDKPTCVRVKDKRGFHIDLPIYYAQGFDHPDLAETVKGWLLSNPVEFIAWFEEKANSGFQKAFLYESLKYAEPYEKWLTDIRKADCQLRRLVRYLKAWADVKKDEMPCGIIMTILVANNFVVDDRDDLALLSTLKNIRSYLKNNGFECPRPTAPLNEDLFASTSEKDKEYFMKALNALIDAGSQAVNSLNQKEAAKLWEQHFGSRFPANLAKDEVSAAAITAALPDLNALKSTVVNKPWSPKN